MPYVLQQSAFLVTDVLILRLDLLCLLQLHRIHMLNKFLLVSNVQLRLQPNDVALDETNDFCTSYSFQSVIPYNIYIMASLPSCASLSVHFQALPSCLNRIAHSSPTSPLNRRLRGKIPISLTAADTIVWSEIGKKEGWMCTNVSWEFPITLSR